MGNRKYEQRNSTLADGFGYELNNQLTSFQRDGNLSGSTVSDGVVMATLALDASGNRTSVVDNAATTYYATANNLNQYPTVAGLAASYDAKGNLATYNGWTYTYNALNQLTHASKTGAVEAYFWYDGRGRICTWQSTGGPGVRFNVWSGWDLVEEYRYAYPADDSLIATYLHGENVDEMVSMTSDGTTKYLYQDGRGNTSAVSNADGTLVETYKYDLNGTPTVYDPAGNVISAGSTVDNRFLFGGREWYQTLGLYNFRNRFYLPNIGRFLQPDPIGFAGDPANLYRYCANNPVNASDPSGLGDRKGTMERIIVTGSELPVSRQGSGSGPFGGFIGNASGSGEPGGVFEGINHKNGDFEDTLPSDLASSNPIMVRAPGIGAPFFPPGTFPAAIAGGGGAGYSSVTIGDIFDYGPVNQQLRAWGREHQADLESEKHFIELVNNVAGGYSVAGLAGIGVGEALAGTSVVAGPDVLLESLQAAGQTARLNSAKVLVGAQIITMTTYSNALKPINEELLQLLEEEMTDWRYWPPP